MLARDLKLPDAFPQFRLDINRVRQIGQTLRLQLGRGIAPPQEIAALASDRLDIDILPGF